jgi:hypothetical protein
MTATARQSHLNIGQVPVALWVIVDGKALITPNTDNPGHSHAQPKHAEVAGHPLGGQIPAGV